MRLRMFASIIHSVIWLFSLPADLVNIMKYSENEKELRYTWQAYRDSSGKKIRKLYGPYVKLSNAAAKLNGVWSWFSMGA